MASVAINLPKEILQGGLAALFPSINIPGPLLRPSYRGGKKNVPATYANPAAEVILPLLFTGI